MVAASDVQTSLAHIARIQNGGCPCCGENTHFLAGENVMKQRERMNKTLIKKICYKWFHIQYIVRQVGYRTMARNVQ